MAKSLKLKSGMRTFLTLAFDEGKTTSVHCSKVTSCHKTVVSKGQCCRRFLVTVDTIADVTFSLSNPY